jgi:hypothetical protein
MLDKVNWESYGVVKGVARDPRCENCMVHCGYDPSGALGVDYRKGDTWKNIKYNFGSRPKALPGALTMDVFNGVSQGKGHQHGKTTTTNGCGSTPIVSVKKAAPQPQNAGAPTA